MNLITLDFETFYSKEFSLSRMTTESYIRDPRFETIGVGVKVNDGETEWASGTHAEINSYLHTFKWDDAVLLGQNTMFDAAILSWRYGIRPNRLADTMLISRAFTGLHMRHSLAKQAERILGRAKGTEVTNAFGKRRLDFSEVELARYGDYCILDCELTYDLFRYYMRNGFPKKELGVIDMTLKMFTNPFLELDENKLERHLATVKKRKLELLTQAGVDKKDLMSNNKFAELLREQGVEPPTKISLTTGKVAYAFAKTDDGLKELLDHENIIVQTLANARVGNKSTLEETRTERFIGIAERGLLPGPISYYAAHCLLPEAEVLTQTGWERLDRWQGGHIMQWCPDDRTMSYLPATNNQFCIDEPLIEYKSRYHNAVYTKGHTIPCLSGRGVFRALKAGDAVNHRFELPISAPAIGTISADPLEIQLAVMIQADGSVRLDSRHGKSIRFGFRKLRKIARCIYLLERAGVSFTKQVESSGATRIYIPSKEVDRCLRFVAGVDKLFCPDLYDVSLDNKLLFINEVKYWDGSSEPNGVGISYSSTSKYNAEFVQTMAHLTGNAAHVSVRVRAQSNWSDSYRVQIRPRNKTRVSPAHACETPRYTRQVYCPTTVKKFFLFRQNGCITVTGNTGRWGGSDKINLQNLPSRGANGKVLKRTIRAPDGYLCLVADSAQIEARIVAWLAGEHVLVDAFDRGDDVYITMASRIYNKPEPDITSSERFIGKMTILGCIAEGTPILCERGWIPIELVSDSDKLWDGDNWVCHQGLVPKGLKETQSVYGSWLTPDHKILCGNEWVETRLAVQDENTLSLALERGAEKLPSWAMSKELEGGLRQSSLGVTVGLRSTRLTNTTSKVLKLQGATHALRKLVHLPEKITGSMQTLFQTIRIGQDSLTEYPPPSAGATKVATQRSNIMGVEVSKWHNYGEITGQSFSNTLSHLRGGITRSLKWIESITVKAMNPITSDLFQGQKTCVINDRSEICSRKLMTYDVAYAGPNNRFTMWTERGPMIVHNCGYGMGAEKFRDQLRAQAGVLINMEESVKIVRTYRKTYPNIVKLWYQGGDVITALSQGKKLPFGREGVLEIVPEKEGILLPNGLVQFYPDLHVAERTSKGPQFKYIGNKGHTKIYGGKLVENICQALAKIVMAAQMLEVQKQYPIRLTVHDSIVICIREDIAIVEKAKKIVTNAMRRTPPRFEGLPLNCDLDVAKYYGDCDA